MNGRTEDLSFAQVAYDAIGSVLGARKKQNLIELGVFQQMQQKVLFALFVRGVEHLPDRVSR
ncbi:MAG: Uncharacterised protein [Flavobacteriia bacterium]|nr:MAG: Uncharacterised protein [Flavobacteriia bacterium]